MSFSGIIGAIGGVIGSGFGIGKVIDTFKKVWRARAIIKEAREAKKEIEDVFNVIDKIKDQATEALADKDLTLDEAKLVLSTVKTLGKEGKEAQQAMKEVWDELRKLFE